MAVIQTLSLLALAIFAGCAQAATSTERQDKAIEILTSKCMDCHSSQPVMPWYSKLPIAKQLIEADMKKGLAYFNIETEIIAQKRPSDSTLSKLDFALDGSMPPIQYKIMHWNKVLTKEETAALNEWIRDLRGELLEPLSKKGSLALNAAQVELGRELFHDTRLSRDNSLSCASCHDLAKGGTDQAQFSTGIGGAIGHINSPTVYNSRYNLKQFWDGRAEDLEAQAHGPVHNPSEMGSNWNEVIKKLKKDSHYKKQFKVVYGSSDITGDLIAKSIAAFEKSLTTPSRFDDYLRGDREALSAVEKKGFEVFTKLKCASCHSGIALGANSFRKMGERKNYFADREAGQNGLTKMPLSVEDQGRFNVTENDFDKFKFKVPSLRNVEITYPYMHDGNVDTLEEAVRIMAEYQVGEKINESDTKAVVAFLKTLTGKELN